MTTLISSEWYKMLRSKAALIILLGISAMVVFWIISNYTDGYVFYGYQGVIQPIGMSFLIYLWYPAFVGYFAATEFQNGTIRNSICIGKSRAGIYVSKLFAVSLFVTAVLLVVIIISTIGFSIFYGFGDIDLGVFLTYFAFNFCNILLYNLALVALFTLFSFVSQSPIFTALIGTGYVILNFFLAPFLRNVFDGKIAFTTKFFPEYYISYFNHFSSDSVFILHGIIVSIVWIIVLSSIGCAIFGKSEIK